MNIGDSMSPRKVHFFPFSRESKNTRVVFIYKIDINIVEEIVHIDIKVLCL